MWPFSKKTDGESVALIDIGSSSVGAALVHIRPGELPLMCYTLRVPVDHGTTLTLADSMLRSFTEMGERLIREGSPQLRGASGSGRVDRVYVTISSPWQEASVETRTVQPGAPFTFTKSLATETLEQMGAPEGYTLTQTVVATMLNGYRTNNPFGKKASRADIVVLSTLLDTTVTAAVEATVRKLFHTKDIRYVGFSQLCYGVLRDLYAHEKEFVVLSVSGESTDVTSVKRGHVIDVGTLPIGTNALREAVRDAGGRVRASTEPGTVSNQPAIDKERNERFAGEVAKAEAEWVAALADLLRTFAIRHALPRAMFLIADVEVRRFLKEALNTPSLRVLWLSDEPVSVIAVEPFHFSTRLSMQGLAEGDTELALLALYAAKPEEA